MFKKISVRNLYLSLKGCDFTLQYYKWANMARKHRFIQGRQIDCIPVSSNALMQHIKQAHYQGCFIQGNCFFPNIPFPSRMGCERNADNLWQPIWIASTEASHLNSCQEIIKCECRGVTDVANVPRQHLKCTALCKCSGDYFVEHVWFWYMKRGTEIYI